MKKVRIHQVKGPDKWFSSTQACEISQSSLAELVLNQGKDQSQMSQVLALKWTSLG